MQATTIDPQTESLLSIADACKTVPGRRGQVSLATLWRWTRHGVKGVRLETVPVGGLLFTSREAIQRFLGRLQAQREAKYRPVMASPRSRAATRRESNRILDEAGI